MKPAMRILMAAALALLIDGGLARAVRAQPSSAPSPADAAQESQAAPEAKTSPGLPPSFAEPMANRERRTRELEARGLGPNRGMMNPAMPGGMGMMGGMGLMPGMRVLPEGGMSVCISPSMIPSDAKTRAQWMEMCGKSMQMWGRWMEQRGKQLGSDSKSN